MQLFLVPFQQPIPFGISTAVVDPDDRDHAAGGHVDRGRRPLGPPGHQPEREVPVHVPVHPWALFFGITLQLVPHEGAGSPYGAIGLIALFTGFFIMMGFLWAVIGD